MEGDGFLEMWSVFADGSRFFSRTLDPYGSLGIISGDSGWRPFRLPFFLEGSASPASIEANVVLPGAGAVWVGPVRLVALDPAGGAGWWSDATAGLVGGITGGIVGVLGAVLGALVGSRRARRFVLVAMRTLWVLGIGLVVAGGVSVLLSQPYAVYFPLLLLGAILLGVFLPGERRSRKAYEDAELRRMRAMDAVGES